MDHLGFVASGPVSNLRRSREICKMSEMSRRSFVFFSAGSAFYYAAPAFAGVLPKSREQLMEELKSKKSPEELEEERAAKADARRQRLERQKELAEEAERKKLEGSADVESEIDANLRANYYFPTARKRYLPRVKECADKIEDARDALDKKDWTKLQEFAEGPADNASGPLKLYASSLAGQGLSLKVSYVEDMTKYAEVYDEQLQNLKKAIKKKKTDAATKSFNAMANALEQYRKAAKIDTPDGGVGEIPSDRRLGSGFSNLIPRKTN
ncbi:hypothetical protein NDN08_001182 [Rhodosorus marinus]|uniref:Uncharacterized protein n=1 Tax=Rhodosorus marinus TaxID=101924 RepID=A0AAV8UQA7_9RHOD|nr:hypothetical protein NDN08_001182 [Rhodosorus marinus]